MGRLAGRDGSRGGAGRRLVPRQRLMLLLFLAFLVFVADRWWRDRVDFSGGEPIRVLVLELVPPGVGASAELLAFNGHPVLPESPAVTVDAIGEFYEREYRRYQPKGQPVVEVTVSGPHEVRVDPPDVDDPSISSAVRLWRSLTYYWYFRSLGRTLGVDFDRFDIRLVALFAPAGDSGQREAESMASRKQRFGVVHLDLAGDWFYALLTLIHEMGHTLGASDKYDEQYLGAWPYGFAEPDRRPPFPQVHAEVMAVDVPISATAEREPASLDEVQIGMKSAWEFGWVDQARFDAFYAPLPASPPEDAGAPPAGARSAGGPAATD
ncbi:hypothetical protein L6R50_12500 [Myxococcota bacterium]|nr:hypothetical protein [Myxococcota bacterium]